MTRSGGGPTTPLEDRVRDAIRAKAAEVPPDAVPPLLLPAGRRPGGSRPGGPGPRPSPPQPGWPSPWHWYSPCPA